jgi:hypothetical protein
MIKQRYLYKYRPCKPDHLDALFNNYAMLSSCRSFADLEDSQIKLLTRLNPNQFKKLLRHCSLSKSNKKELELWLIKGSLKLNEYGKAKIDDLASDFQKIVNRYAVYCLASIGNSIDMWERYADNHQGFCIEFKSEPFPVTPMKYTDTIPTMSIIKLIKIYFGMIPSLPSCETLGKDIHKMLHYKRKKFEYEGECRFIGEGMLDDPKAPKKKEYSKDNIASVIFGAKMKPEDKQKIIKNISYINFKQAVFNEDYSQIFLQEYKENDHLYYLNKINELVEII